MEKRQQRQQNKRKDKMNSSEMLRERTLHVIESCETIEQLLVATRYTDLACQRIISLKKVKRFDYAMELQNTVFQKFTQLSTGGNI